MPLIVEDGTGMDTADALISVAYADTFHLDRNNEDWTNTATDAEKEAAIRNASMFFAHSINWRGNVINGRDQLMPFPRSGLIDQNLYAVASNVVPREVQQAIALLALYEYDNAGTWTQTAVETDRVLTREKIGPLEEEYSIYRNDPASARPVVVMAMDLVKAFILSDPNSSSLVGRRTRV